MSDLTALTVAGARARLAAREFSARELVDAHIAALEAGRGLNAFVAETFDRARAAADGADARLAAGEGRLLEGIPLGVKDLFCTRGVRSQACSNILDGFAPPYESTVTANLWAAGALMLGKTNMDEFAMGSSNETSYYGPVRNPWRHGRAIPSRWCPAAAPAARRRRWRRGSAVVATGTDTGGSIRQPAAFCGHRPASNRVTAGCSRYGMVAFASSLDQGGAAGPQRAEDAAIDAAGDEPAHDPADATSLDRNRCRTTPPCSTKQPATASRGKTIGRAGKEFFGPGVDAGGDRGAMVRWKRALAFNCALSGQKPWRWSCRNSEVRDSLPTTCVAPAEASSNLARFDGDSLRPSRRRRRQNEHDIDLTAMYEQTRDEGFGARGQTPHHDRHLRAFIGLLRRLLHQGAKTAAA